MRIVAYGPDHATDAPAGTSGPWLIPSPARDARAYQSRGTLTGQPGTQPIPAPDPSAIPPGNLPTLGRGNVAGWPRRLHASVDSPPAWLPALYYQSVGFPADNYPGLFPPVSYVSDNQLPVPAVDPRGLPVPMARRPPRLGGRNDVPQPFAITQWPKWTRANQPPPPWQPSVRPR